MRRFGRNQKRRLREEVLLARAAAGKAEECADYARRAHARIEEELRQITERLRRLLGPNTAVLEPERVAFEREHRELECELDLGDRMALSPFRGPAARGHERRTVLMRQLEARVRIDPGPPRSAIHLIAEVRAFGRRVAVSRYFATDEGLVIQSAERFAHEAGRELAEYIHRSFVVREGRICEREHNDRTMERDA